MLQITTNHPIDVFRSELSKRFPPDKVDEILKHYNTSIHNYRLNKYSDCLVEAGKAVEAVLKCYHYLRTQEVVDSVKVEYEVNQLEQCKPLNDSERITLPRTLRLIYEHRNRRGGAHNNSFNPNHMDASYVVAGLKWVLGELARLYLTSNPEEAQQIVTNLLARDLPLVEEIDGAYLFLLPDLSARVQLEVLLYRNDPQRCQFKDLVKWIGKAHTEANVRATLANLRKKALVHENQDGWRLTESGLREAVDEITKIQPNGNDSGNYQKVKTKGTRNGR